MNRNNLRYLIIAAICAAFAFGVWKYRQPNFSAGDAAPDFGYTRIDGQQARFSDLQGKYVLIQFWGSWCGPCRMENPRLYGLYRKYHNKGFEIVSIAQENNPGSWQHAIKNDRMEWRNHTMEQGDFSGPLAQLFNIKSIPATFLVNPEGRIMGVNLRPEYLEKMLGEKLGS